MMLIDLKFKEDDIVYLVTDPDQLQRVVTAVQIRGNLITYELSCGSMQAVWCQEVEMAAEKNVLIA